MWEIPKDVNWVEARFRCSTERALMVLQSRMQDDIAKWSALTGEKPQFTVESRRLIITRSLPDLPGIRRNFGRLEIDGRSLVFTRGDASEEKEKVVLIPRLNLKGECALYLDNVELTFWQASMKLLESVLFA